MIDPAIIAAFVLGISGSLHCVGMCGPLVLALPAGKTARTTALGRVLYHIGRVSVYAMLGSVAGIIGGTAYFFQVQSVFSIVGGIAIIILAFGSEALGSRFGIFRMAGVLHARIRSIFGVPSKHKSLFSMFGAGIGNGFLPCGLIFASLAGAAVMQSPVRGALFMAAFGIGTIPVMLGISLISGLRSPRLRPFFRIFTPVGAVIAGCVMIFRGLTMAFPPDVHPNDADRHCSGIRLTINAPQ